MRILLTTLILVAGLSAYTLNDMGQGYSPYYEQNRATQKPVYKSTGAFNPTPRFR